MGLVYQWFKLLIMKYVISICFVLLFAPKFLNAQVCFQDLEYCKSLSPKEAEELYERKFPENSFLPSYVLPGFNNAKAKYQPLVVFYALFDWEHFLNTGEVIMYLDRQQVPFGILYLDNDKIKLVAFPDLDYRVSAYCPHRRSRIKFERGLKTVLKDKAELVLISEMDLRIIIYISDGMIKVLYKREKMSLYDYFHKYKDDIDTYVHRYNIMKGYEPLPDFSLKLQ